MSLQDSFAADMLAVFLSDDFAEDVVYTAKGQAGRTIRAQVFREPYSDTPAGKPAPSVRVIIARHATLGVLSVNKDADTVTLAERRGGTAKAHPIAEIASEDSGGIELRLR